MPPRSQKAAQKGRQINPAQSEHLPSLGKDALAKLAVYKYDLVILDLMLPDMSGKDVCRAFRQKDPTTPVLMLTSVGSKAQTEECLDGGADDYVTKPFDASELCARIRALIRRGGRILADGRLVAGNLVLDVKSRTLEKSGSRVHLLPREFTLLEFFMRHPGQVFNQEALLDRVWHSTTAVSADTVRAHIKELRKKIDDEGQKSRIRTMHGQGYVFES